MLAIITIINKKENIISRMVWNIKKDLEEDMNRTKFFRPQTNKEKNNIVNCNFSFMFAGFTFVKCIKGISQYLAFDSGYYYFCNDANCLCRIYYYFKRLQMRCLSCKGIGLCSNLISKYVKIEKNLMTSRCS